jgi:hypothetical protein
MDVRTINQGTMIGFAPVTTAAEEWLEANVVSKDSQWLCGFLWVDYRYASDLMLGLIDAGFDLVDVKTGRHAVAPTHEND